MDRKDLGNFTDEIRSFFVEVFIFGIFEMTGCFDRQKYGFHIALDLIPNQPYRRRAYRATRSGQNFGMKSAIPYLIWPKQYNPKMNIMRINLFIPMNMTYMGNVDRLERY